MRPLRFGTTSLAFCAFAPLTLAHLQWLWARPHYQYFPVVIFACILLGHARLSEARTASIAEWRFSRLAVGASLVLLAGAVVLHSPWLAMFGAILIVAALLAAVRPADWREVYPCWLLLFLLLPLPMGLDDRLARWLQALTSRSSSEVLDFVGIRHAMTGNVLRFPGFELFVDEACSGINSVFALIALTSLYAVWQRVPAIRAIPLIASSPIWACLLNIVRVTLIAVARERAGIDLSYGTQHTILGFLLFVPMLLLIGSMANMLEFFFGPLSESWMVTLKRNRIARFWNALTGERVPAVAAAQPVSKPDRSLIGWGVTASMCIVLVLLQTGVIDLAALVDGGAATAGMTP